MKQKKLEREYVSPLIKIFNIEYESLLLAGSGPKDTLEVRPGGEQRGSVTVVVATDEGIDEINDYTITTE